jgi:hypothetical protein
MTRKCNNWIDTYISYTKGTEAPRLFHFFAGVSCIAGALRRKVWIDQIRFKWFPGMYIVLVADPGIATKSTTADLAMELLQAVPGIKFGPDNVTWQSLVTSFAGACESFEWNGEYHPMSPLTLVASEFGSLMDLHNQEMVNLFITLWDGRKKYEKETKMSGTDVVEAPWINLLACTTPSWIATNMDQLATSGGLTSRTIYVFAEAKANYIAYLDEYAPTGLEQLKADLTHDLEHMAVNLAGPFTISPEARSWGRQWYEDLWTKHYSIDAPDWSKGYIARKQTHVHKLAMILSASRNDSMRITQDDLQLADQMLLSIETDLAKVFAKVGKSDEALAAAKILEFVTRRITCPYEEALKFVHSELPNFHDFEGILNGLIRSAQIRCDVRPTGAFLSVVK